ncbi:hypothetical protein, partial [Enterococcus mundtii]|uniref:hypothetical protein n=1 Tax=Enterococcus mundtii TaxID=53346 RepID=UPI0035C264FF
MKKFLLACLGILATVSFAACGPKVSEKPKSHSPKQSQQIPRKKQSSDTNGTKKKKNLITREMNRRINSQVIVKKRRAKKTNQKVSNSQNR